MSAAGIVATSPGSAFGVTGKVWNSERREFISQQHMDLATVLHDYNPYFSLVYVPENDRTASTTKPFAILDSTPGKPPYIMRYLSELEMLNPKEIVAWIFMGDQAHHSAQDILKRIELEEMAERALQMKRSEEELLDQAEMTATILSGGRDHKNFFRHDGRTYRR